MFIWQAAVADVMDRGDRRGSRRQRDPSFWDIWTPLSGPLSLFTITLQLSAGIDYISYVDSLALGEAP
jgi:hypothetical protein